MLYQHWLAFLLSLRGEVVKPRPIREGDTWSRRVPTTDPRDACWRDARWLQNAPENDAVAVDLLVAATGGRVTA